MTRKRKQANDADPDISNAEYPDAIELPPIVTVQERRMQVRARNYWLSLRGGQEIPELSALDPHHAGEFAPYSLLLEPADKAEEGRILYLGTAIQQECGIEVVPEHLGQVPQHSLLSQIADHCQTASDIREPVAFEAEFINQRGAEILSRGMMMPFTGPAGLPGFLYIVVNWKEVASDSLLAGLDAELRMVMEQEQSSGVRGLSAEGQDSEKGIKSN
ncbi:MAG: PAS domain-containing protein [Sphingobium sp.]|nr:PAS domain-containing protein [Sphingobium sp.]